MDGTVFSIELYVCFRYCIIFTSALYDMHTVHRQYIEIPHENDIHLFLLYWVYRIYFSLNSVVFRRQESHTLKNKE